ncbi:hypothetical protein CHLRE_01g009601v5 [Chlamydomonas reinhardtii]|uniref:Uncharacterized protein n=1 Tax=Chlamydomonas reinhardtii TaxID=3055 RepID=A0A2K3E5A9_CHLRE|nr:uncharacterized protein CHLRE_01g009601v5 [Chlamydomonas reinhardtii]PNW87985.1 hypothetical protein CHLRE_01g009601v5 [Chlamydomonas reinhardtii]
MMDDWQHGAEAVGCKVFSKAKAEEFGVLAVRCVQGELYTSPWRRRHESGDTPGKDNSQGSRQPGQARAGGPTHTARAAAGAEAGVAAGRQHKPPSSRN